MWLLTCSGFKGQSCCVWSLVQRSWDLTSARMLLSTSTLLSIFQLIPQIFMHPPCYWRQPCSFNNGTVYSWRAQLYPSCLRCPNIQSVILFPKPWALSQWRNNPEWLLLNSFSAHSVLEWTLLLYPKSALIDLQNRGPSCMGAHRVEWECPYVVLLRVASAL